VSRRWQLRARWVTWFVDQPEFAVEVTTESSVDCEVLRDVSADRFVEETTERESTRVTTADNAVDRATEPMDDAAEVVDDNDCELKVEMSSRE
jgi:hypothetical protein